MNIENFLLKCHVIFCFFLSWYNFPRIAFVVFIIKCILKVDTNFFFTLSLQLNLLEWIALCQLFFSFDSENYIHNLLSANNLFILFFLLVPFVSKKMALFSTCLKIYGPSKLWLVINLLTFMMLSTFVCRFLYRYHSIYQVIIHLLVYKYAHSLHCLNSI